MNWGHTPLLLLVHSNNRDRNPISLLSTAEVSVCGLVLQQRQQLLPLQHSSLLCYLPPAAKPAFPTEVGWLPNEPLNALSLLEDPHYYRYHLNHHPCKTIRTPAPVVFWKKYFQSSLPPCWTPVLPPFQEAALYFKSIPVNSWRNTWCQRTAGKF